jgi:hypothetical protein
LRVFCGFFAGNFGRDFPTFAAKGYVLDLYLLKLNSCRPSAEFAMEQERKLDDCSPQEPGGRKVENEMLYPGHNITSPGKMG